MLEKEYQFLLRAAKVMNHDRVFSIKDIPQQDLSLLYELRNHGLLTNEGHGSWRITKQGKDELYRLEQVEEQRAKDEQQRIADRAYADQQTKKQFRHNWRVAIFEVFVGFALGAIVDHFFDIISKCANTLSTIFHP